MYLSRIKLNTQKRETMKALVNPQQIHGAIEVLNGEPSEASDAADEKSCAQSLAHRHARRGDVSARFDAGQAKAVPCGGAAGLRRN